MTVSLSALATVAVSEAGSAPAAARPDLLPLSRAGGLSMEAQCGCPSGSGWVVRLSRAPEPPPGQCRWGVSISHLRFPWKWQQEPLCHGAA